MKTKYQMNWFQYLEYEAIAQYLETMAKKGWILEKIGYLFKFRKQEPQDLLYTVDFQPKITLFTPQSSDEAEEYRRFCEEAGWNFVCGFNKMQIFSAKRSDDPTPIQTEEQIQYKVLEKSVLPPLITTILLFLYEAFLLYNILTTRIPIIRIDDDMITCVLISFILIIPCGLLQTIRSCFLLLSNKKRIHNGLSMKLTPYRRVRFYHMIDKLAVYLLIISFLVPIFFTNYPILYLYTNIQALSFAVAGPLLGILLVLIREHINLKKEYYCLLLMLVIPLCLMIGELLDSSMAFQDQKLSFLKEKEPFYAYLSQNLNQKGNWYIETASTSHVVPIKYALSFHTDFDDAIWNDAPFDGFRIEYAEYTSVEMAEKSLKEQLIDHYTYDHGYLKEVSNGTRWVYAPTPEDRVLYAAYPNLDIDTWHISNGYQMEAASYLIQKDQRIYYITCSFQKEEEQSALQHMIKAYFTEKAL